MSFIALLVILTALAHPLQAEKKPNQTRGNATVVNALGDCSTGYAPFNNPEELNQSYYDMYAWRFEQYDTQPCHPDFKNVFNAHWRFAPGGAKKDVLDIGAGPGHAAKWMQNQGHNVECIASHQWFKHYCTKKSLPVTLSSLREFRPAKPYDMVVGLCWPFNHIRPEWASQQIARLSTEFLKPGGLFIAAIFMGCGITYEDPMNVGHKRYFVNYTDEQWRSMIRPYFEVISVRQHFLGSIKKDVSIFVLRNKAMRRTPAMAI